MLVSLFWRLLDPLLLRVRSRLDHLEHHHPSRYHAELARTRGVFHADATVTNRARVFSAAPREHLEAGRFSYIDGEISLLTPDARCVIGEHSFLGAESRLWIQRRITIGNFVLIAPRVDIFDNDSHSLDATARHEDAIAHLELRKPMEWSRVDAADVIIEDAVWIGTKSTIMKGVRLGRGAVIAAASVVTHDVEPFTLVGGNPARVLRRLS